MSENKTVYLIDDDASVRRGLGRLLKSAGYDVVMFDTSEAYLALRSYRKPSCLLLDIRMPGMTGLELQRALREQGGRPSIVLLSGHADAATAERAMSDGAVAVLSKPVDYDTLVKAIELGLSRDH
jgi:two-component system, LuxR family, response regulator FixJ